MQFNEALRRILRLKKATRQRAGEQTLSVGLDVRGSITKLTGSGGDSSSYDSYEGKRT